MRVGAVITDLMLFSRIESAATAAEASLVRVDSPADQSTRTRSRPSGRSARQPEWTDALRGPTHPRVILFGQHTDLEAHADARAAGLGPMWARSKLIGTLAALLGDRHPASGNRSSGSGSSDG